MRKEKTVKNRKKKVIVIFEIVCVCLFFAGASVFSYPFVREYIDIKHANEMSSEFDQKIMSLGNTPDEMVLPELWDELQTYNVRLATTGQEGMRDILEFERFAVDISSYGFPDNIFGYVEIPVLNRTYPLYLGSNEENMAKGATVLGESSAPIGGESTHCIIAAHNYWSGAEYFQKISLLSENDIITITNPWETLTYRVIGHKQIKPDEFNDLFIQEGKDLLTLFTCYPNGKSRWCVFCERVE